MASLILLTSSLCSGESLGRFEFDSANRRASILNFNSQQRYGEGRLGFGRANSLNFERLN